MIEAALKRFDERTHTLDKRIDLNFKEMENQIDKAMMRSVYLTVSILGALMAISVTISSFAHYFWR